jgi:hypothetical protein
VVTADNNQVVYDNPRPAGRRADQRAEPLLVHAGVVLVTRWRMHHERSATYLTRGERRFFLALYVLV